MYNIVLINNSRTAGATKILLSYLNFSENLLQYSHIIFQRSVDFHEVAYKTCSILVWGAVFPLSHLSPFLFWYVLIG